ncbi:MAG TPA: substrate-binding domain-containing protein [Candidatus Acidoferrum sp.]|nr:substrate-binding domain-containing protein [Candidatus Acidoferrum sp.]
MRSERMIPALLAVLVVTGLTSCQAPYHQPDEHYVFVAANITLPYWQEAQAGLYDASTQMGVKADLVGPEKFDPQEELRAFQTAVASKATGILISVTRPELFQDAINGAISQGIPVICVDSDAPDSKRLSFIGTDNFRAGEESGKRIAQILQGKGQIVVVTIPGQLNLDERLRGVQEALKKFPGMKIIQTLDDNGDPRVANDSISGLLQAKAKFDGIVALEASGGSGAAEALHRLDMAGKIPIVAFDKDPETLDWIDRGVITATVAQKPYVMSYYGLKFLDDLHHNAVHEFKDWRTAPESPLPTWVDTGTSIVDKTNLKAFRDALAAHPKPI